MRATSSVLACGSYVHWTAVFPSYIGRALAMAGQLLYTWPHALVICCLPKLICHDVCCLLKNPFQQGQAAALCRHLRSMRVRGRPAHLLLPLLLLLLCF